MPEIIDAANIVTKNANGDFMLMQRGNNVKRIAKRDFLNEYDVLQYGLFCNGVTDDTAAFQALINLVVAAGGGTIVFPEGQCLISGGLQDTGNGNAQICFPAVALSAQTVSVTLKGRRPPATQFPTGSIVPRVGYSTIKSTLTGASGTAACISGTYITAAPFGNQTNIQLNLENLIFEAPANPSFTMINCQNFQGFDYWRNILIHVGSVNMAAATQPTHTNAYGFKVPEVNHSCFNFLQNVMVHQFYFGGRLAECNTVIGFRAYACFKPLEVVGSYHTSIITDCGFYWCPYGVVATNSPADGIGRIRILLAGHEMASTPDGAGAWQLPVNMVEDPGNVLRGDMVYQVVQGGVGESNSSFVKNGGSKFLTTPIDAIKPLGYTPATSTENTYPKGTVAFDDSFLWFRTSTGVWKKIALATF
jgi:hypothetical protein